MRRQRRRFWRDWTFDPGWLQGGGQPVIWCHISAFPLPELLQYLRAQRWEAQIRIRSAERRINVTMRHGRVDFVTAQGVGSGFRLGRFLVSVQAIDRVACPRPLSSRAPLKGCRWVKRSSAPGRSARNSCWRRFGCRRRACSTSSCVGGMVRPWFWSSPSMTSLSRETGLGLTVEQLLMEGFRHEDEWNRLQSLLPRPDEQLEPNLLVINGFDLTRLAPLEREALGLLRKGGSLAQLLSRLSAQPIEVCRAAHVLLGARLVRRKEETGH